MRVPIIGAPKPEVHHIGLRWRKSQLRVLRNIRERALDAKVPSVQLYDNAIAAVERGEPLVVICERPEEALAIAHGFVNLGAAMPELEDIDPDKRPILLGPPV